MLFALKFRPLTVSGRDPQNASNCPGLSKNLRSDRAAVDQIAPVDCPLKSRLAAAMALAADTTRNVFGPCTSRQDVS